MAILNDGINGGFRGKVGSIIGYNLNGKWIIKGLPRLSRKNKKGTEKQKAARTGFTKIQFFLSPLLYFIRVGFNLEAKSRGISAHNAAKSYNMRNALQVNGTIDYAQIGLSYGSLADAKDPAVTDIDGGLCFTWAYDIHVVNADANDQVMLVAYNLEDQRAHYMLSGARRKSSTETLAIPGFEKGKEMHTWISFISDDRENISMSTYMGSLVY